MVFSTVDPWTVRGLEAPAPSTPTPSQKFMYNFWLSQNVPTNSLMLKGSLNQYTAN